MNATALLSGFQAGLVNSLLVSTHIVALLGLALMIGQQTHRHITMLAFAAGLIGGLLALALAIGETPVSTVLLVATAATGLVAASGWPMPGVIGAPLALIVGAGIGLDSPPRALSIQAANATLAGTGLGALLAVALIAAVVTRLPQGWPHIGVRVLGSWIAASAVLALALQLAR